MNKRDATALLWTIFAISPVLRSQVLEPEYVGILYYLDAAAGTMKPIEWQRSLKVRDSGRGLSGFGIPKTRTYEVDGEKCPTRLSVKTARTPEFVIQPPGPTPPGFELHEFVANKGKRQAVWKRSESEPNVGRLSIALKVSRHGQHSFKLTPSVALTPGEYGFVGEVIAGSGTFSVACFGVEPYQ